MIHTLMGQRILITRPRDQGEGLRRAIIALGGDVLWIPAIETAPCPLSDGNRSHVQELGTFAWLAFASANAVRYFLAATESEGVKLPAHLRVAAVGTGTAKALEAKGLTVHARPERATGLALAEYLASSHRPARLLLPRGESAREELVERLAAAGWDVVPLVCYRTRPAPLRPDQIFAIEQGVHASVFASPSAVRALWENLPETGREAIRRSRCLPIGPTTAAALLEIGLKPAAVPEDHSVEGIVAALEKLAVP